MLSGVWPETLLNPDLVGPFDFVHGVILWYAISYFIEKESCLYEIQNDRTGCSSCDILRLCELPLSARAAVLFSV
jgi:hypothetical protein